MEQSSGGRSKMELLQSLKDQVRENLSLLTPPDRIWHPTDFLPDLAGENWSEELKGFRQGAQGLSDELLVVLVGGMVTEEALPSYSVALNLLAEDQTGTSPDPWACWLRGWTAEENRHGDLLNAYLRLTGRVNMRAIEATIYHLLRGGFNPKVQGDPYGGLVYTSFQERATRVSHGNVGRLAAQAGDASLARICRQIAGDESRHEAFYTRMMGQVFDADPSGAMVSFRTMMRRGIAMPGKAMTDGKDPDLFDHFATVGQRTETYTVHDYAQIIAHLVDTWRIGSRAVSGAAAEAQEYLCRQAERYENMVEPVRRRLAEEPRVAFSWIHDREA